jgi:preprotein translocase subunit SecD
MEMPVIIRAVFLTFFSVSCGSGAVTFALRLVVPCDTTNTSPPMSIKGDAQEFCLEHQTIVDEADVKSAAVTNEQKGPWVRLTLMDAASKRLLEATRKNIGKRIAVVLNGRLIAVPVVQAAISDNVPITGSFTQQQADDIAAEFNHQAAQH